MDAGCVVVDIEGARVGLGPLRPELFALHTSWMNDSEVGWNVFGEPVNRTVDDERAWLLRESGRPDACFFQVYRRGGDDWDPIGVASLTDIDARRGTATYRITIGPREARGLGYGTEATRLVLGVAFGHLALHNVMLHVYEWNEPAIRMYERCGFRPAGRRREVIARDGRRWDVISMDCLAADFAAAEAAGG